MSKQYITAKEIAETIGMSESFAYKIIRELNAELKAKGYITVSGRVSRAYFEKNGTGLIKTMKGQQVNKMREYIEIPLDTYSLIEDLTNSQAGELFKAILNYYFNNIVPDFSEQILTDRFQKFTKYIRKGCENSLLLGYAERYED